MVRENNEKARKLCSFIMYKQDCFWRAVKRRSEPAHPTPKPRTQKQIHLNPIPNLQPRWSGIKRQYGIKCGLSVEKLTGGRILTIDHMSSLLSNHPLFEWENYGVEWEIDHVIPFELMDKALVSDRYKLNHYSNLEPQTSEKNKKDRAMKIKAGRPAETEAARPAEPEASRPAEPESLGF
jgi:hypothetical protein